MRQLSCLTITIHTVLCAALCPPADGMEPGANVQGRAVGKIASESLNETSGIAASRANPGVFWGHNDSGDTASIYAFGPTGAHLGMFDLKDVEARDCEDIAVGPGPVKDQSYIYLGDIGDNYGFWDYITIYRITEPVFEPKQSPTHHVLEGAVALKFKFPDGPRDAETLMVDPLTRDIYIVTKREFSVRVYRAPWPQSEKEVQTLKYICSLGWTLATAGDISPDGSTIVVRSYYTASIWKRKKPKPLWESFSDTPTNISLSREMQGESICFDTDGKGCYTTSEGYHPAIYYYGLGQLATPVDKSGHTSNLLEILDLTSGQSPESTCRQTLDADITYLRALESPYLESHPGNGPSYLTVETLPYRYLDD